MKNLSLLVIATFLFFSFMASARQPGDKRVTAAFVHRESGYSVIEVEEFIKNPLRPSIEGYWSDNSNGAGFYWGNPKSGFFKIYPESYRAFKGGGQYHSSMKILAPLPNNLKNTADLEVHYTIFNSGTPNETRKGNLQVSNGGASSLGLETVESERMAIHFGVRAKTIALHPLPVMKKISFIFKFPHQEKYIVVDQNKLPFEGENFEALIWENGKLTFEKITDYEDFYHGPVWPSRREIYLTLENKNILHFPAATQKGIQASLIPVDEEEIPLLALRGKGTRKKILDQLALPKERYETPILRTPCEILLESWGIEVPKEMPGI